ncbi:MAG: DMT family transporter, partial [Paracoccaceae bacterium]
WGLYWLPLYYVEDQGLDGGWAVAMVNVPALAVLIPLLLWQWGQHKQHLPRLLLIGFFTGAGLALYASGLVYSSVVRATLLFYLTPVWATLIGMLWLGEQATWSRWGAIGAGLAGLVMLVSGGGDSLPLNIGDLFALLSGMFWAIGASLIMRHPEVPVAGMMTGMFAVTGVIAISVGHLFGGDAVPSMAALRDSLPVGAAVAILVFIPTVWSIFWAQKFLFPGRAGLLMMSEVMMAVITASLLLPEETMGSVEWAGAALIIFACLLEVFSTPGVETSSGPA